MDYTMIHYNMVDLGKIIILMCISSYFMFDYFKTKKLSSLILTVLWIADMVLGGFLINPYKEKLTANTLYPIINVSVIILMIWFCREKKTKKQKVQ